MSDDGIITSIISTVLQDVRDVLGIQTVQAPGLVARLSPIAGVTTPDVMKAKLYLPCVLNTLTVSETALHNEYNTLSSGEFSQPAAGGQQAQQLRTLELDTLTLAWNAKWLTVIGKSDSAIRGQLKTILRSRQPVRLMINFHPRPDPEPVESMMVTLRSSTDDVRPGENDTRYLTFQISQWRDATTGRRGSRPSGSSRKAGTTLPTSTTITADDTLNSLSMEYYGNYAGWRDIRDANSITTRFGPSTPIANLAGKWKPGAKIRIPQQSASVAPGNSLGNLGVAPVFS